MSKAINTIGIAGVVVMGVITTGVVAGQSIRITRLEKENEKLKNKNKLTKRTVVSNDNSEAINNLSLEVDNLTRKVKSLSKDNSDKDFVINDRQGEINILRNTIAVLRNDLSLKPKVEIREVPIEVEVIKEVEVVKEDSSLVREIEGLRKDKDALSIRCSGQLEKIKELKCQLRESSKTSEELKEELNIFKMQIKNITESKTSEADMVKQVSRVIDRVSKKASRRK